MNKILFDLSATQPSADASFHGGSEYSKFVFYEAIRRGITFDVCINSNFNLHQEVEDAIRTYKLKVIYFKNNSELKEIIKNSNYSRFYSGLPYGYKGFSFENVKFYMTIHGLRELEMDSLIEPIPYYNSLSTKVKLFIKHILKYKATRNQIEDSFRSLLSIKNKHVITVSKHSLYSICNYFPFVNTNEISVCSSPLDLTRYPKTENNKGKYFLLVSANRWIKNNLRAIQALDSLYSKQQVCDINTIVLGCESMDFTKYVKNTEKFTFLPYVSKEELESYFQNAFAFIYPTLNEGYGYPPLQAMKYDIPVLASAISSVPEVCKEAALYFNPFSVDEIAIRILQISKDIKFRNSLINKGTFLIDDMRNKQSSMIDELINTIFY